MTLYGHISMTMFIETQYICHRYMLSYTCFTAYSVDDRKSLALKQDLFVLMSKSETSEYYLWPSHETQK